MPPPILGNGCLRATPSSHIDRFADHRQTAALHRLPDFDIVLTTLRRLAQVDPGPAHHVSS
jgi:hypothetical protein